MIMCKLPALVSKLIHGLQIQPGVFPGNLFTPHGGNDAVLPADGDQPLAGGHGDHWCYSTTSGYGQEQTEQKKG